MTNQVTPEATTMNLAKTWTRKCRGCDDHSPHSHHLTWFGRFYFRYIAGGRS